MDQVFSQWSFPSQLLTRYTCFWKQEHLHFPSITAGSEVLLLRPYFLCPYFQQQSWQLVQIFFDSTVHFWFGFVFNSLLFVFSGIGEHASLNCAFFCFLFLAVFCYLQQPLAIWRVPLENTIYISDQFFRIYGFELTTQNQAVFLRGSINSPRTFVGGHNFSKGCQRRIYNNQVTLNWCSLGMQSLLIKISEAVLQEGRMNLWLDLKQDVGDIEETMKDGVRRLI